MLGTKRIKYTKGDIIRFKRKLQSEAYSFREKADTFELIAKNLNQIILVNKDKSEEDEIYVDENLLSNYINKTESFSWKEHVLKTLRDANHFLTCNMIFEKISLEHFSYINNKRNSLKNISSALSNLTHDGKIGRVKENGIYYYGDVDKHFYKNGQPIMGYKKSQAIE